MAALTSYHCRGGSFGLTTEKSLAPRPVRGFAQHEIRCIAVHIGNADVRVRYPRHSPWLGVAATIVTVVAYLVVRFA